MVHDTCSAFSVSVCGSEEAVVLQLWDSLGVLLTNCQENLDVVLCEFVKESGDYQNPFLMEITSLRW